jgi:hypothetical protein
MLLKELYEGYNPTAGQMIARFFFKAAKDCTSDDLYNAFGDAREPRGWENGVDFDKKSYSKGDTIRVSADSSSVVTSQRPIFNFTRKYLLKAGLIEKDDY